MNDTTNKAVVFENVTKAYNGKSGCMCGCRGKYRLPSHSDVSAENKKTGYEAYEQADVSDRSVKLAVKKINAVLATLSEAELKAGSREAGIDDECAWIDDGERTTVVYFN